MAQLASSRSRRRPALWPRCPGSARGKSWLRRTCIHTTTRAKGHLGWPPRAKSSCFRLRRLKRIGLQNFAALFHDIQPVYVQVFDLIDLTAKPADFEHIHLGSLIQTEVNARIVLRKITAAAAQLFDLNERGASVGRGFGGHN